MPRLAENIDRYVGHGPEGRQRASTAKNDATALHEGLVSSVDGRIGASAAVHDEQEGMSQLGASFLEQPHKTMSMTLVMILALSACAGGLLIPFAIHIERLRDDRLRPLRLQPNLRR